MNTNTNTASANTVTSTPFVLADPTSGDVRAAFGVTPARADAIVAIIAANAKAEGYGENIHGQLLGGIANLPLEAERLFGAWAVGHGLGMSDDSNDAGAFDGGENPLAALMANLGKEDDTLTDDDAAGI